MYMASEVGVVDVAPENVVQKVSLQGSTPVPGSFPGLGTQVLSGGYPSPRFFPRSLVPGHFPGDTPVPGSFPGLWSQVLTWGNTPVPGSFLGFWFQILTWRIPSPMFFPRFLVPGPYLGGVTPAPGSFPGLWTRVISQRVPQSQPGGNQVQGYPLPVHDWGIPTQAGLGYPSWLGLVYPPPPTKTEQQSK